MGRGLSQLQQDILVDIAERARNPYGVAVWAPARGHDYSIPLRSRSWTMTRTGSAVLSRALARLEARGLVERVEGYDGVPRMNGRTGGARLTEQGREEVKRLTKDNKDNC